MLHALVLTSAWLGGLCERKKRKRDSRAEDAGDAEEDIFSLAGRKELGFVHTFLPLRGLAVSARGRKEMIISRGGR